MAANPLPLLALAGAAFFLMKRKDEPKADDTAKPSTNGNGAGGNGADTSSDKPADKPAETPDDPDHPGWSDYGDGTVDVVDQRDFADLDGSNPVEFRPNKEGEAVLLSDIDSAWTYEMRFPVSMQGQESDFAEIHHDNGNILWVSTAGARPLEELKLEGVPDPSKPSERVLLAWM